MSFKGKNLCLSIFFNIQCWSKDYKYHRLNGPAIIYSDGSKSWYKNGKLVSK